VTSVKLVRSAEPGLVVVVVVGLAGADDLPQPKLNQARLPIKIKVEATRSEGLFFIVEVAWIFLGANSFSQTVSEKR
jgi:hypothetical protein